MADVQAWEYRTLRVVETADEPAVTWDSLLIGAPFFNGTQRPTLAEYLNDPKHRGARIGTATDWEICGVMSGVESHVIILKRPCDSTK